MAARSLSGHARANPQAEVRIATLLALFRGRGLPVVHVMDDGQPDCAETALCVTLSLLGADFAQLDTTDRVAARI
jgi:hypothetical protein